MDTDLQKIFVDSDDAKWARLRVLKERAGELKLIHSNLIFGYNAVRTEAEYIDRESKKLVVELKD